MVKAIIFDFFGVLTTPEGDLPNHQLLAYIRENLKPHYKLGIVSNAAADWVYEILDRKDVALFDDIIISHRAGIAKPELAIYEMALENLKVRPEDTVFIDDIELFCDAARAVGMQAILYQD